MTRNKKVLQAAMGVALVVAAVVALAPSSSAHRVVARARLIDDTGKRVGSARFTADRRGRVEGHLEVTLPTSSPDFHGVHIHANEPATGCVPGTGFTGVGGHWDVGGHTHGNHSGDLPSVIRQSRGKAEITFKLDKFTASDIVGRAVIVHAGPDNFGNVPLGTAPNQYTDNGSAYSGTGGTALTGNAGARYACGVIRH